MSKAHEFDCATGLLKCQHGTVSHSKDFLFLLPLCSWRTDGRDIGIINAVLGKRSDQEVLRDVACLFLFPLSPLKTNLSQGKSAGCNSVKVGTKAVPSFHLNNHLFACCLKPRPEILLITDLVSSAPKGSEAAF